MKLGKLAARHDPRTLALAAYVTPELPPLPEVVDVGARLGHLAWGMMGNNEIGDCTIAAVGHQIMAWTAWSRGVPFVPSTESIIAAYEAITGYDPKDSTTDNGAVELDVLNYWRKNGIAGHRIAGYVALEPRNHYHVRQALQLFGGVYIGAALPVAAQHQRVWSVPPQGPVGDGKPGSWGGHAILIVAADPMGLTCITWGQAKRMTWGWFETYVDESYAVLSDDWMNGNHLSPMGFDIAALAADLRVLGA